jgi:energy-coupling factor transporter ATP-binding protein EcfA2
MLVKIKNCNNIEEADICIESNKLNLKYAINGTGKSTIAQALYNSKTENMEELRSYKYLGDEEESHSPQITIDTIINKIAIFNENYVNTYAFQPNELVKNSFEIFIKTDKYDERMKEISTLVSDITATFKEDPEIDKLIEDLGKFVDSFGKTQNGYSKASDLGKTLGKGNKLEDVPNDLIAYKPYLKAENGNVRWLKWQSEGKNYLDITDKCPYCVSEITTPKEAIIKVGETYDTKYLAALSKVLEVFNDLSHYFDEATQNTIKSIIINTNGITDEEIGFLKSVKDDVERLLGKLKRLKYIGFGTLKNVEKVLDELTKNRIILSLYPKMQSTYTGEKIKRINDSLELVIEKAGKLQGQIVQQKKEIQNTIQKYNSQINGFLESAGYKYCVCIEEDTNENYRLLLKTDCGENNITNVKSHLSYGERNAFALVLFMYQTLKEGADFIILDDPISSFDMNKKYAILNMLFRGKETFQGKTVLLLTHDFEPVIDTIYNLPSYFDPTPVANFLANVNGIIEEKSIRKENIQSYLSVCDDNIRNSEDTVHKLIYLRRLLEITEEKNIAWQLVSNIFHKNREKPRYHYRDHTPEREMVKKEIEEGERIVQEYIGYFKYDEVYNRLKEKSELIKIYDTCKSGYEKVQIYRLIFDGQLERGSALKKYVDETFHVQNDYLFQLNPREYKIVPQYILDCCDKDINNLKDEGTNYEEDIY